MRRRPQEVPATYRETGPYGQIEKPVISRDPQVIAPFLVSGGQLAFQYAEGPPLFDPRPDGVQLVTYFVVPPGKVAFIKQIRIAPFMPAVFSHPFRGWPGTWPLPQDFPAGTEAVLPGGQLGVWSTPFGWEGYVDQGAEPPIPTVWKWSLRIMDGDITKIKNVRNIPPVFNIANAATWWMVPDIAVPRSAYPGGLPGRAAGYPWSPQRLQVLQADQLTLHVPVTEEKTVCLFAEWKQATVPIVARNELGQIDYAGDGLEEYPLLPSFGQLLGYTQIQDREAAYNNAIEGWNG